MGVVRWGGEMGGEMAVGRSEEGGTCVTVGLIPCW
jgi:hypothetical protein